MKRIVLSTIILSIILTGCGIFGLFDSKVSQGTRFVSEDYFLNKQTRNFSAREVTPGNKTPTNVEGKVITASMMVGDYGGSALFLITPDEAGFSAASVDSTSDVLTDFNLSDPIISEREMTLGDDYPADSDAVVSRVELLFAYVDITVDVTGTNFSGEQTVRVVYADVTDLGYKKGDLLFKGSEGVFKWGDKGNLILSVDRPANPIQIADIAAYDGTEDGMGNQYIPTFSANIPEEKRFSLTKGELTANSWIFNVVFDLTGGVTISDESTIEDGYDLLWSFDIQADVGTGELGFKAWIEAEKTP